MPLFKKKVAGPADITSHNVDRSSPNSMAAKKADSGGNRLRILRGRKQPEGNSTTQRSSANSQASALHQPVNHTQVPDVYANHGKKVAVSNVGKKDLDIGDLSVADMEDADGLPYRTPIYTSSRLSKTFQEVIHDKEALPHFVRFMDSRRIGQYIRFWLDANSFQTTAWTRIRAHAQAESSRAASPHCDNRARQLDANQMCDDHQSNCDFVLPSPAELDALGAKHGSVNNLMLINRVSSKDILDSAALARGQALDQASESAFRNSPARNIDQNPNGVVMNISENQVINGDIPLTLPTINVTPNMTSLNMTSPSDVSLVLANDSLSNNVSNKPVISDASKVSENVSRDTSKMEDVSRDASTADDLLRDMRAKIDSNWDQNKTERLLEVSNEDSLQ